MPENSYYSVVVLLSKSPLVKSKIRSATHKDIENIISILKAKWCFYGYSISSIWPLVSIMQHKVNTLQEQNRPRDLKCFNPFAAKRSAPLCSLRWPDHF